MRKCTPARSAALGQLDSNDAAIFRVIGAISCAHDWEGLWRAILTRGYHGLSLRSVNQYHSRAEPYGRNMKVDLPSAPARCAVVLLTVTTTSQAVIKAAKASMSLVLSMS